MIMGRSLGKPPRRCLFPLNAVEGKASSLGSTLKIPRCCLTPAPVVPSNCGKLYLPIPEMNVLFIFPWWFYLKENHHYWTDVYFSTRLKQMEDQTVWYIRGS